MADTQLQRLIAGVFYSYKLYLALGRKHLFAVYIFYHFEGVRDYAVIGMEA